MSCCNGKCGCGADCSCGSGCKGCGMYPNLSETTTSSTSMIMGVAPKVSYLYAESEMGVATEGGCKCGDNCQCNPCNCK